MTEKFVISDTHFFHANILKFTDKDGKRIRPFSCLEEMHTVIRENWNRLVRTQDKIYHLGDVTFQYHGLFSDLMGSLNGHKRLIVGNHDKIKNPNILKYFEKISLWRIFKEEGFVLSHIPLRPESMRKVLVNVHGHLHQQLVPDPHYINVCVEHTGYSPVHFDQIIQIVKELR